MDVKEMLERLNDVKSIDAGNRIANLISSLTVKQQEIDTIRARITESEVNLKNARKAEAEMEATLKEIEQLKDMYPSASVYEESRACAIAEHTDLNTVGDEIAERMAADETEIGKIMLEMQVIEAERAKLAALAKPEQLAKMAQIAKARVSDDLKTADKMEEDDLIALISSSKVSTYLRGLRMAIFGGKSSKGSSQALISLFNDNFGLKNLEWYESEGNRNEVDRLLASIKNGGTDFVVILSGAAQGISRIKGCANINNVSFVTCPTFGKRAVITEIVKVCTAKRSST